MSRCSRFRIWQICESTFPKNERKVRLFTIRGRRARSCAQASVRSETQHRLSVNSASTACGFPPWSISKNLRTSMSTQSFAAPLGEWTTSGTWSGPWMGVTTMSSVAATNTT
eukprot:Amastigsp_a693911_14.p4 type:complete len:112 gc:universal Amastigsp_a693911_14:232-567(+)